MQYEGSFHLDDIRHLQDKVNKALMRQLLPEELAQHRTMTLRWRLYALAAKVVRTGRQLLVKRQEKHRTLLEQVLLSLKEFEPPPI